MPSFAVRFEKVSFSYPGQRYDGKQPVSVLQDFSLDIEAGKIVCLFGPNGCGKSTVLRLCAGLLKPDAGVLRVADGSPGTGDVGYIPQAFRESLMPWLHNLDNIAFPLYMNGMPKEAARKKGAATAAELSDELPLTRYPHEVSTGQQQMVSLARALVRSPSIMLADEPFSALDFQSRREMHDVFHRVLKPDSGIAALIVTHSIDDAVHIGDQVVVTTRNPMEIVDVVNIDEPRPRTQDFKRSQRYFDCLQKISGIFLTANA